MDSPANRVCPVCGKYKFKEPFEECPICNWINDVVKEEHPDEVYIKGTMSLNEAREAYKNGKEIN